MPFVLLPDEPASPHGRRDASTKCNRASCRAAPVLSSSGKHDCRLWTASLDYLESLRTTARRRDNSMKVSKAGRGAPWKAVPEGVGGETPPPRAAARRLVSCPRCCEPGSATGPRSKNRKTESGKTSPPVPVLWSLLAAGSPPCSAVGDSRPALRPVARCRASSGSSSQQQCCS